MSAPQNAPHNGTQSPRDRKNDVLITVLVSIILGFLAGTGHRVLMDVPIYTALETGVKAGGGADRKSQCQYLFHLLL